MKKNKTLQVRIENDLYEYLEDVSKDSVSSYVRNLVESDYQNNINYKKKYAIEYKKCKQDLVYFVENYCYMKMSKYNSVDCRIIQLYDFQKDFLNKLQHGDDNDLLCIQSRMMGISSLLSFYALWVVNFKNNASVGILSHNTGCQKAMVERFKTAYDNLPEWLRSPYFYMNDSTNFKTQFQNGSTIYFFKENISSTSLDVLLVDNFDFIDTKNRTINFNWVGNKIVLTVNSILKDSSNMDEDKYKFLKSWWDNDSIIKVSYPYQSHPIRGIGWKQHRIKLSSSEVFVKENECPVDFE